MLNSLREALFLKTFTLKHGKIEACLSMCPRKKTVRKMLFGGCEAQVPWRVQEIPAMSMGAEEENEAIHKLWQSPPQMYSKGISNQWGNQERLLVIKQAVNWLTACNVAFNFLSVQCANICVAFSLSKLRNKKSKSYQTFTCSLDETAFLAGFSRPRRSKLLGIKKYSELIFNYWQEKGKETSFLVLLQMCLSGTHFPTTACLGVMQ